MKIKILKDNIAYVTCYLLLLIAMVAGLCCVEKGEMHLWLNSCHTPCMDVCMRYFTKLAEWPLYLVMLCFIFKKPRWTLFFALSELMQFLLTQILKYSFVAPRPITWFAEQSTEMQMRFQETLVDGVTRHALYSFPSGHTATFFVFFTCLCILLTDKCKLQRGWQVLLQVGCFALAALGGYSRIYLSQHFLMDVCVGSLIGAVIPFVVYTILVKTNKI